MAKEKDKSLESWIWDAACSIRGAKDAAKYKDYILPLIFTKRLCDVFDDEVDRIAKEVGSRKKAFQLTKADWRKAGQGKTSRRDGLGAPEVGPLRGRLKRVFTKSRRPEARGFVRVADEFSLTQSTHQIAGSKRSGG